VEVYGTEGDLMAGALTTQFAQGPRVTETLATVVARIDPPAGFTPEQVRLASEQAAQSEPPEVLARFDIESRKYGLLKWALTRRDEILRGNAKHG
jgi:hypothetical protein